MPNIVNKSKELSIKIYKDGNYKREFVPELRKLPWCFYSSPTLPKCLLQLVLGSRYYLQPETGCPQMKHKGEERKGR